jgi:hypothetical protein
MDFGDLRICHDDEGEVSKGLDPICEPGGEYGEGEVGRVEEGVG